MSDGAWGLVGMRYESFAIGHRTAIEPYYKLRFDRIGVVQVFGRYTSARYDGIFPATNLICNDDTLTLGVSYQHDTFEVIGYPYYQMWLCVCAKQFFAAYIAQWDDSGRAICLDGGEIHDLNGARQSRIHIRLQITLF
jgi:hypothetical protein